MLKTIAHPLICFMLIFSILAPSVLPLLDRDCELMAYVDTPEEKKGKEKETEKKFDEKNLFLDQISSLDGTLDSNKNISDTGYRFSVLEFHTEILLPPPRKLV